MQGWIRAALTCGLLACTPACGDDDWLTEDAGGADASSDAGTQPDAAAQPDAGPQPDDDAGGQPLPEDDAGSEPLACVPRAAAAIPDALGCEAEADDYAPCTADGYAACVSDDGEYHRVEESISTIGRVEGFEQIAELLFDPTSDPSPQDFLDARMIYQVEEGLDSRVVRRYDPHVDAPDGTDCALPDVPGMYPEYCVGPAVLQPLLLDAFNAGAAGDQPREQAARIEAALLWFLYVSTYKEGLTCTDVMRDCDSAYAYYTGGEQARGGIGLARYIADADPYAHDRAWDGLLAVRCWRDLDDAEVATDTALRDRARTQYDRALLDGLAAVLIDRLSALDTSTGMEQRAHFAFVTTLGPWLLERAAGSASGALDALEAELAKTGPASVDAAAAIGALEALFPCP